MIRSEILDDGTLVELLDAGTLDTIVRVTLPDNFQTRIAFADTSHYRQTDGAFSDFGWQGLCEEARYVAEMDAWVWSDPQREE